MYIALLLSKFLIVHSHGYLVVYEYHEDVYEWRVDRTPNHECIIKLSDVPLCVLAEASKTCCLPCIQYVCVSMMNGMACSGHPLNIALGVADLDIP